MSILQSIFSKIIPSSFGSTVENIKEKVENAAKTTKDAVTNNQNQPNQTQTEQQNQSTQSNSNQTNHVDVVSILDDLAKKNAQKLNWRTSIVDLLKLLGLDSSLDARKKLATELHYTGDMNDSATMNIWLIKEVMRKIAEKGGNVKDLF